MATMRTPLGRVRGLGAAKDGTGHWWAQRVTAIALVPLTFLFVVLIWVLQGADHAAMVAAMANPLVAALMLTFIVAGFYHMKLGVQVVIEDYIHHEGLKVAALLANALGSFALATLAGLSVLKLAFGG